MKEFLHELRQLARDMGVDLRFFIVMARYYAFTPTQLNEMLEADPDTFGKFLDDYMEKER